MLLGLAQKQVRTSPALLYVMYKKKLKNLFWAFCQLQNCLQYCSALKMDIMPRSQHKQDTLSVPAVLGAISATGHEDVKGTGQKISWESLNLTVCSTLM